MLGRKQQAMTADRAAELAIVALGELASAPELASRFFSLTGLDPSDIRDGAGKPEFQAAVLEYILGDESLLLSLCAQHRWQPQEVAAASSILRGERPE